MTAHHPRQSDRHVLTRMRPSRTRAALLSLLEGCQRTSVSAPGPVQRRQRTLAALQRLLLVTARCAAAAGL